MGYTTEQLESIEVKMYELPKIERRKQQHNKKEAIKVLVRAIASLRKRGYTLEHVADFFRGEDLDITERTLRNYLQRAKPGKKAPAKKAPAKKPGDTPAAARVQRQAHTSAASFDPKPDSENI